MQFFLSLLALVLISSGFAEGVVSPAAHKPPQAAQKEELINEEEDVVDLDDDSDLDDDDDENQ